MSLYYSINLYVSGDIEVANDKEEKKTGLNTAQNKRD